MRHDSNVDDDNFRTNRLEDVCNRGDQAVGPFGSPCSSVGTLRSDPRSRFVFRSKLLVPELGLWFFFFFFGAGSISKSIFLNVPV